MDKLASDVTDEECKKYYQLTLEGTEEPVGMPSFAQISSGFIYEYGAGGVSMKHLLGTIIRGPKARSICNYLADELTMNELMSMSEKDFLRIKGIGPVTAAQLAATFEISKRVIMHGNKCRKMN
ncbi:hypothetical protein [Brevibacillus reuszeri]|uniref:hypothetical protein n=1 Tax=Brevibacillus reuszeri TaxID=54915 RepID=UPI000CCC39F0|nr:hypothetical protein [Brevibacillus reuszeri]